MKLCSENATFYRRQSVVYRQWHPVRTAGRIAAGPSWRPALLIPVYRNKVVTSEVLGPGSVLLRRGKRVSAGEEECRLQSAPKDPRVL